jgi:hypothetical protein
MSGETEPDIEYFIELARSHGVDDPEREISDLQELLRVAWALMTASQRASLVESDEAQTMMEDDDTLEGPDDE